MRYALTWRNKIPTNPPRGPVQLPLFPSPAEYAVR